MTVCFIAMLDRLLHLASGIAPFDRLAGNEIGVLGSSGTEKLA